MNVFGAVVLLLVVVDVGIVLAVRQRMRENALLSASYGDELVTSRALQGATYDRKPTERPPLPAPRLRGGVGLTPRGKAVAS